MSRYKLRCLAGLILNLKSLYLQPELRYWCKYNISTNLI